MTATREELTLLHDTARQWIGAHAPARPNHRRDVGRAQARWSELSKFGWAGVALDEQRGGSGMGFAGMGILLLEAGRELVDVPLLSSALLATQALRDVADRGELIAGIADGSRVVAVAVDEGAHHAPEVIDTTAKRAGNDWILRGRKHYVLNAEEADHLIVAARAEEGVDLFLVDRAACRVTPLDMIDGRSCAHVDLDDVRIPANARLAGGAVAIERVGTFGRIGVAAEMLGATERMLEIIVDYLKTREQFGRPIGSFQALQHRAAQMLVALEVARCAVDEAWAAADRDDSELPMLALVAKYVAGEAAHLASNEMVQMHGGIGMTSEHVAGRYLKWVRASEQYFGGASWLASRYATVSGF